MTNPTDDQIHAHYFAWVGAGGGRTHPHAHVSWAREVLREWGRPGLQPDPNKPPPYTNLALSVERAAGDVAAAIHNLAAAVRHRD